MPFDFDFQNTAPGAWVPVESSWLAAARWLPDNGGRIEVRTKRGVVLPWSCDEATFRRFLESDSKGKFLNRFLKGQASYLLPRA